MDKFFKIVFWTAFGLLFCGVVYLTVAMYLSPRQDVKERGFIPCTKQLVIALQNCQAGKLGCPFKLLAKDMVCNIGVVQTGAADWFVGKQPTPWANYLFEPELYENGADSVADAQSDKSDKQTMQNLEQNSQFVEQKLRALEEAKHRRLNIKANELLQNPEQKPMFETADTQEDDIDDELQDDISAESDVLFEKTAPSDTDKPVDAPHNEVDLRKKIRDITQEKLQKGNLKDEK